MPKASEELDGIHSEKQEAPDVPEAKSCKEEIRTTKVACCIVCLFYVCCAWLVPSMASLLYKLLSTTLIHLVFHIWVTSTNDSETLVKRYSNLEYFTVLNSILLGALIGESSAVLAKGVSCCIIPVLALSNCRSTNFAMNFCVLHFASFLYNIRLSILETPEDWQWLVLVLLAYALAITVQRRTSQTHESYAKAHSAYAVFEKMLTVMCDGYFVLDADGSIIGLDRKASSMITADAESAPVPFNSLLPPAFAGEAYVVQPGLEKVQLKSADGQFLEAECYTCDCNLYPDMLPLVLGLGSRLCKKPQPMPQGQKGYKYLCALRIVGQVLVPSEQVDEAPIEIKLKRSRCRNHHANAVSLAASPSLPDAPPGASDASSATSKTSRSSGRKAETVGERVDSMLMVLDAASRKMLAKEVAADTAKECMKMKTTFKRLVKDVIDQTHDQLSSLLCFCAGNGHLEIVNESIEEGACEDGVEQDNATSDQKSCISNQDPPDEKFGMP